MKQVSLDKLANELAKPGFERELIPLLMYRGRADLGRYHRMWNFAVAMMMHEAESLSEGVNRLQLNPEWSHLCFPEKRMQMSGMYGLFTRLRDNPSVTDLIPGFTDYVKWVYPRFFSYERVPLEATRARAAWWRTFTPKQRGKTPLSVPDDFEQVADGKSAEWASRHYGRSLPVIHRWYKESDAELAPRLNALPVTMSYPFLLHEATRPEHELLRLINDAIPHHLPPELRADMCQDLAVGCLTGEFNKDDLYLPAKEVAKRVYRMFPTKYGPLSLDAPLSSDSEFSLLDTLVDEGRDWA